MSFATFPRIAEQAEKELEMHCFMLFNGLNWKRFLPLLKKAINDTKGSSFSLRKGEWMYNYFSPKNMQAIMDNLKNDREAMSRFDGLRIPDRAGLLEERYICRILRILAMALAMTAAKMDNEAMEFIREQSKWKSTGAELYFTKPNALSMHFLGEKSPGLDAYRDACARSAITKKDVARLAKELAGVHAHKTGWLEEGKR